MSSLPSTLEEMQYAVLQGDLSANPKLQASPIPAKDKELKTVAKKIIPAINELLKTVTTCKASVEEYSGQLEEKVTELGSAIQDTIKTEQLNYINEQLNKANEHMNELVTELSDTLKKDYAKTVDEKFETLKASMAQAIEDKIQAMILEGKIGTGSGAGGETMKKVFHSKVLLKKGQSTVAPFKFSELQDIKQQITGTCYSEQSRGHVMVPELFYFGSSSTSSYATFDRPIDVRVDIETDEIKLFNNSGLYDMQLYFFTME